MSENETDPVLRPETCIGLGVALLQQNRPMEAMTHFKSALKLNSQSAEAAHYLGHASLLAGQTDAAISAFQKAAQIEPGVAENYCNLANGYATQLKLDLALAAANRALFLRPDLPDAHWNKAMILLVQGNFTEGWIEHEWRWIKFAQHRRNFRQPIWDGTPVEGKTILLHAEQGAGDTIQFSRFVTDVARRGAKVVLECQPSLVALLSRLEGVARVIPRGQPLPDFDAHCPLLSLPFALGIDSFDAIAASSSACLRPPDQTLARWNELLKPMAGVKKIGIVWSGDPSQGRDFERSAPPQVFQPLEKLAGVKLFNLQKSPPNHPIRRPPGLDLIDFTSRLHDFAETAGLIANLDLVISVDTSVAHLAGAMGKPAWTMLAHHADWRYFLNRTDCPWYPAMRLFRQSSPRNWDSVIQPIIAELQAGLAQSTSTSPFIRG